MIIKILEINKILNEYYIKFQTNLGIGQGIWKNSKEPIVNNNYNVEIELTENFIWNKNIKETKEKTFLIGIKEKYTFFIGRFVDIDDFKIATIDIDNNIIFIKIDNLPLEIGSFIKIIAKNIYIYNTNM